MLTIKRVSLLFLIGISLVGCRMWGVRGSGHSETETRNVDEFSEIDIAGSFDVDIEVGKNYFLQITADDNLLDLITTKVHGNRLEIDTRKDLNPRSDIKIKIQVPNLEALESSGANDIWVGGINEKSFYVDMSGAGSIELSGEAEKVIISLSGAGDIDAKSLYSKKCEVSISGAASADVYASEFLDAEVSGVGSINFYGDPEDVRTSISGVGSIDRK